jgi:hypothetical protein
MSNDSEHVEEQDNNKNNDGDNEESNDPRETSSMRHFLNQLGESQREALEKIFDSSIDNSCLPSCENQIGNQMDMLMVRRLLGPLTLIILYNPDTAAPLFHYVALSATIELLAILSTARKHVREWRR